MKPTWRGGRWLIILPPLIFLLIFFLIPFAFAFKISFAEAVPRVPPFTDVISFTPAIIICSWRSTSATTATC